jgi:hypothetical protein
MVNFPDNPTIGQVFSPGTGTTSWQWDGTKWVIYQAPSDYLMLHKSATAPALAGAGAAVLYMVQGTGSTATLRIQAGTNATPVDIVVNVGGGF